MNHSDGVDGGGERTRLDDVWILASGRGEGREDARAEELEQDEAQDARAQRDGTASDGLVPKAG